MFDWLRRLFHRSPAFPRVATDRTRGGAYSRLRHKALNSTRTELNLPERPAESPAWGVVMERGYPGATITVAAFAPNVTSLYGSDGKTVIGGEFDEYIRQANVKLIDTADQFLEHFEPRHEFPIPQTWQTIFYLRTDSGTLVGGGPTDDLVNDRHALSPLFQAAEEIVIHFRELAEAEKKQELQQTVEALSSAIARKPKNALLYVERADAYLALQDYDRAIADHDAAVSVLPCPPTWLARGCLYASIGEFDEALADFDRVIAASPRDGMAYSNRGAAYSNLGDVQRAIEEYGLAIKYQPRYANSYANRAYAYYKIGEYEKGLADCNKALSLRPDHANTWTNRGHCRAALGDVEGARADFNHALELPCTQSIVLETMAALRALDEEQRKPDA
jgi:tetratricopeptide (TPR) repeat protein